ncbi:peptidoglycan-binding protein [Streptomyces melanogenes]|uniref:peptidoglycan-binding protein n=1 Tax=Streptomyces melanogenes TaxID=67326 RepID=UPI0037A7568B
MLSTPQFTEIPPADGCLCGGCLAVRQERRHGIEGSSAAPLARGARAAAVVLTSCGVTLSCATAASALGSAPAASAGYATSPTAGEATQGPVAGLYGAHPAEGAAARYSNSPRLRGRSISRSEVLRRAQSWVNQQVPYSMGRYWSDGYRQDCSGFVSMAWGLGSSQTTWTLPGFATRISKGQLKPGDILVRNNTASPQSGSHVVLFGGWADASRTHYIAYEQTRPHTKKRKTPYTYWNHSGSYVPYRYNGITDGTGDDGNRRGQQPGKGGFPGAHLFGPGAHNDYVARLGAMLTKRGAGHFYTSGPGPRWSAADQRATAAFQRAQGWSGADADGIPGRTTWEYLVHGRGKDIPAVGRRGSDRDPKKPERSRGTVVSYPGAGHFRPGRANDHVLALGRQLVRKGFGRHYALGPSRAWGEADRRNVAAFQRAQGWRGADADGYPGPQTWRLLFG